MHAFVRSAQVFTFVFSIFLGLLLTTPSRAQQEPNSPGSRSESLSSSTRFFGALNFSPLDLLIPMKYGASLGWSSLPGNTNELEYIQGSLAIPFLVDDLGKMKDERVSFIFRRAVDQGSFHLSYGLTYFHLSMTLGNEMVTRASVGQIPTIDLVNQEALGFHLGFGNQWWFQDRWKFMVDWIGWDQPLWITSQKALFLDYVAAGNDRAELDRLLGIAGHFPRLYLLKVQLAYFF